MVGGRTHSGMMGSGGEAEAGDCSIPRFKWVGLLVAVSSFLVQVPARIQAPMSLFDEGLYLTLVTFTGMERLPYRDLWTLYGPGPAFLGALITEVVGDGLLAIRLVDALAPLVLVAVVYLFSVRYVQWWLATAFALAVSVFAQPPHHFAEATVYILIGLLLIDRALTVDSRSRRARQLAIGAFVLGLAFMGRYEFVVVSIGLVGLMWVVLVWCGERPIARSMLWGLVGPAAFLLYLVGIVGWDKARVNLLDYPLGPYSDLACRGIPTPWQNALASLVAPSQGSWWSGYELMLGLGTFAPPLLAILLGWIAVRSREKPRRSVMASATALLMMFVWIEMRPRAGSSPQGVWPYLVAGLAICLGSLPRTRSARAASATFGLVLVVTTWLSWPAGTLEAWTSWPNYDPKLGFANSSLTQLYDSEIWSAVAREVHEHSEKDEPIFVALMNNTGHFANAPLFYWFVDRPPGTRFIEFNPCLTDTAHIQREMVSELAGTNVVILTSFYPSSPPPSGPTDVLDEYLAAHFKPTLQVAFPPPEPGAYAQEIHVLVRDATG